MKIYDITKGFLSAPLYPGTEPPEAVRVSSISDGGVCNVSHIMAGSHISTHCDACLHFIDGGTDIANMPLEHYAGDCYVLSVPSGTTLERRFFEGNIPPDTKRLLIHGGDETYLSTEAAEYIADSGIITLGTEAMSVGSLGDEAGPHKALLGKGVAIIEQLRLDGITDGNYLLFAAPIKIEGCDGAPCRALLVED